MTFKAFQRRGIFSGRWRRAPGTPPPPATPTAPTAPSGLAASGVGLTSLTLSWTAGATTDALNVLGTKVYQDGVLIATVSATSLASGPLTPNTAYSFTLKAYTSALDSVASSALVVTTLADTTPDDFSFTTQTGVAVATVTESNIVTLTGLAGLARTNVVNGEARLNGGAWSTSIGGAANGNTVQVRHTSAATSYTSNVTTLVVGSIARTFTTTTLIVDTTPDAFTFTTQTEVAASTVITSNAATITGINAAAVVEVYDGEWRKNGVGAWFSTPGTVVVNDTITLRHTSASTANTSVITGVSVGGVIGTFRSTTAVGVTPDTDPDAFSFATQTGVAISTVITSAAATITGITGSVTVSIRGTTGATSEWSVSPYTTWTASAGTITNGTSVKVRLTSSALGETNAFCTLTVGTGVASFLTTTAAAVDQVPDQFTFTDVTGVAVNTLMTSAGVTISGITAPTSISVSGGEYSKGPAGYTTAAGTVNNGQVVRARHTSSAAANTPVSTVVTIGGVVDTFTSRTLIDTEAPSAPVLTGIVVGLDGFQLNWTESTDNVAVTNYILYDSAGAIYNGLPRQHQVTGLAPSTTKTYTVKAYDEAFNLSAASNAVPLTTPPPANVNRTLTGAMVMPPFVTGGGFTTTGGAALSITNLAGATVVNHGNPVTLNGSGFGTKVVSGVAAAAAPLIWDNCSGTNINTIWTEVRPSQSGASHNMLYRPAQRGVSPPHARNTATNKYIAGAHYPVPNPAAPAFTGGDVIAMKTFTVPSYPMDMYLSWYDTLDPAWVFNLNTPNDNNHKKFRYSYGDPYGTGWYWEFNNSEFTGPTVTPTFHFVDNISNLSIKDSDANGHSRWWDSLKNPIASGWVKHEMEMRIASTNAGFIKHWEDGVQKVNYQGSVDKYDDYLSPPTSRNIGIGGYSRCYPNTNNWRYFADIYVDRTLQRVMLCNNSNYNSATIREPQTITAWAGSQITFNGNLGKLTNGATAYLFVVDATGAKTTGYSVTVGA